MSMHNPWQLHFEATQTYGAFATVRQIDETLNVIEVVDDVSENGAVLNLGGGISFAVNSLITTRRPDITIVSVDAGYVSENLAYMLPDDIDEDKQYIVEQNGLEAFNRPEIARIAVGAMAQDLPFRDETFDAVFSHSAVPYLIRHDRDVVLEETLRVAKPNSTIILGPHEDDFDSSWANIVKDQIAKGNANSMTITKAPDLEKYGIHLPYSLYVTTIAK